MKFGVTFALLLGAAGDLCVAYTPVTNAAYALFDPSHAHASGTEGHPVVNVSYEEADGRLLPL